MSNFKPLYNQVLVKRLPVERYSEGGILLHSIAQETNTKAEVTAVGVGYAKPDGTYRPTSVKVGDIVQLSQYAGTQVQMDGSMIVTENKDILAVIGTVEDLPEEVNEA